MSAAELNAAIAALTPHVIAVALCAARLAPVAFLCPLLGGSAAPMTVKLAVILSLALGLHVAAGVAPEAAVGSAWEFGGLALRELVFGTSMGLVASLPFDAAKMGGRFIDLFRGSSAEAALPHAGTREAASGEGLYQLLVALAVTGLGLPVVLGSIFRSFAAVKLGAYVPTEAAASHVVQLVGSAFATGLAVGGPVAGLAMAVDCFLGIASRAAPQMNLGEVGAPLRILGGGAVLWLTVGLIADRLLGTVLASESAMTTLMEIAR